MSRSIVSRLKEFPTSRRNVDIISPNLCDDILKRLGPSLAQYVGCTIIDINPGVGLFSTKLHALLRPRSHVFIEPRQEYYLPFLKPFLDEPGSRYHFRDWPEEKCWVPKYYTSQGLMPNADGSGGPSPASENPNILTLIIGNIAHYKGETRAGKGKVNDAASKAFDYACRARQSANCAESGPPRMLVWMSDIDKHSILPRTVDDRGKSSLLLEEYCHAEEVVGSNTLSRRARRQDALEAKSRKRVSARMQHNGVQTTKGREWTVEDVAIDLLGTSRAWHQELRELERSFKAQELSQFVDAAPGSLVARSAGDTRMCTSEFIRMKSLQRVLAGQNKEIKKVQGLVERQAEIDRLELEAVSSDIPDQSSQNPKIEHIDARIAELKNLQSMLRKKELYRFMYLDDDRRVFEMDPPLLMWDRRKAEPLLAHKDEFYQPKELALLDFQANDNIKIKQTTSEQEIYYDMLASALLGPRGPTTLKSLDKIGLGAYQALTTQAPALRDPRKGGRRDLENVRARTMTSEMFFELAVAWDKWPFKPSMAEMLNQILSSNAAGLARQM